MTDKVENISSDLINHLRNKAEEYEGACLAMDEGHYSIINRHSIWHVLCGSKN